MEVLVEKAIELALELQQDARYLAVQKAQQDADNDQQLQDLIGEFNLKRIAINEEETREDGTRDADKLRALNAEIRDVYAKIMENEHMIAYNAAKTELDGLSSKINAALVLAIQGQDPHAAAEVSNCSGDCGSCGGCH